MTYFSITLRVVSFHKQSFHILISAYSFEDMEMTFKVIILHRTQNLYYDVKIMDQNFRAPHQLQIVQ